MNIELFKIFSGPMPKGSREYTINMDVEKGTLILLNWKGEMVEESTIGLLWCQSVAEIGMTVQRWFKLGYPVETGWAYPATVYGGSELGFFLQGAARMAEKLLRDKTRRNGG